MLEVLAPSSSQNIPKTDLKPSYLLVIQLAVSVDSRKLKHYSLCIYTEIYLLKWVPCWHLCYPFIVSEDSRLRRTNPMKLLYPVWKEQLFFFTNWRKNIIYVTVAISSSDLKFWNTHCLCPRLLLTHFVLKPTRHPVLRIRLFYNCKQLRVLKQVLWNCMIWFFLQLHTQVIDFIVH